MLGSTMTPYCVASLLSRPPGWCRCVPGGAVLRQERLRLLAAIQVDAHQLRHALARLDDASSAWRSRRPPGRSSSPSSRRPRPCRPAARRSNGVAASPSVGPPSFIALPSRSSRRAAPARLGGLRLVGEVLRQLGVPVLRLDLLAEELAHHAQLQHGVGGVLGLRIGLDEAGQLLQPVLLDLVEVLAPAPSLTAYSACIARKAT